MSLSLFSTAVYAPEPAAVTVIKPRPLHRNGFPLRHAGILLALWTCVFFAALFSPALLDDADATHAQAAQNMAMTGDYVTLHVNGIRYLEKPPLPYWLVATSFRIFGFNTFAVHLPIALAVLGLALLGYAWARQTFGERAALFTALATLTSTGVFLFTRVFIPEAILALLLCVALYSFLQAMDPTYPRSTLHAFAIWVALALAVLTKGLIAPVFFFGAAIPWLLITGKWRHWRRLHPFAGIALFLGIAAPWHILASLRNTGGANGHGFLWFYFVNEHVLRFLGRRIPRDYNKLPALLYWSLHLAWLFPWSLFAPPAVILAWRNRTALRRHLYTAAGRTVLLLTLYSAFVLLFFSFSTNQEYYTFPAYMPMLMLLCAGLVYAEQNFAMDSALRRGLLASHAVYAAIALGSAIALASGLWMARGYPFVPDIGDLLARRGVGDYTLSMSHFFDLTGASFAALRLPASLALVAFAIGPIAALILRGRQRHFAATCTVAATSAMFLVAAHIALVRFQPMLSSKDFAEKIEELADDRLVERDNDILLFGDQAFGSSIPFYLNEQVQLVDGRSTSMLFGSTFPDAPPIFINSQQLAAEWGTGRRHILFVPAEKRDEVDRLLGSRQILLEETSGKRLVTDRPLNAVARRTTIDMSGHLLDHGTNP